MIEINPNSIIMYLETIIPTRLLTLIEKHDLSAYSPIATANLTLESFGWSKGLYKDVSIENLLKFLEPNEIKEFYIDDFNNLSEHSIYSEIDETNYIVMHESKEQDVRDNIIVTTQRGAL